MTEELTYAASGVDIDKANRLVDRIKTIAKSTARPGVMGDIGGFGGLFSLNVTQMEKPVLVSSTDGVGTKLKIAFLTGRHDTVGIDLVAMCVNDALCCGAEPLFFLDYVAMPKDDPPLLEQIVDGITNGCIQADSALLGGETAILPDLYAPGDYDLAGFCVGVVPRKEVINGSAIVPGDVVIGVASSGLHSNGYSLARKIVFEMAGLGAGDHVAELDQTAGEALLEPTRIYVKPVRQVLTHYRVKAVVHGIAHITGGGLVENIERIVPPTVRVVLDRDSWTVPPVFPWLARLGNVDPGEMDRVFNMGIGLALIVSSYYAESIRHQLADSGLQSWPIGRVEEGAGEVAFA